MPRALNSQIHVRVPAKVHGEVAKETMAIDPWKSIDEAQSANPRTSPAQVELEVAGAVKEVRKSRRE